MQNIDMAQNQQSRRPAVEGLRTRRPTMERARNVRCGAMALMVGAMAFGLASCASLTPDTMQDISLTTDPPGADCRVMRNNAEIARANPTPATVSIEKGAAPITIECERTGYLPIQAVAESAPQAMMPAAVLDSLVGLATAGAAGALNQYVSTIDLAMTPDPALPVNLSDLTPVEPVTVEQLNMPLLGTPPISAATE